MLNNKQQPIDINIIIGIIVMLLIIVICLSGHCDGNSEASYEEHINGCIDTYGAENSHGCIERVNYQYGKDPNNNQPIVIQVH